MSTYDDVDREAAADWLANRFEHDDRPTRAELDREEEEEEEEEDPFDLADTEVGRAMLDAARRAGRRSYWTARGEEPPPEWSEEPL